MFPWSGRQNVLIKLFVSSKNARFCLMRRQPNLRELAARKFDARNLRKKLVQVSCASFLTVCHHHNSTVWPARRDRCAYAAYCTTYRPTDKPLMLLVTFLSCSSSVLRLLHMDAALECIRGGRAAAGRLKSEQTAQTQHGQAPAAGWYCTLYSVHVVLAHTEDRPAEAPPACLLLLLPLLCFHGDRAM